MQPFSIKQKKRDITFVNGNGFDSVKNHQKQSFNYFFLPPLMNQKNKLLIK